MAQTKSTSLQRLPRPITLRGTGPVANRQKVDSTTQLAIYSDRIHKEVFLLDIIEKGWRKAVRSGDRLRHRGNPVLVYKGSPLFLCQRNGRPFPRWRDITPWLKLQMAAFALDCEVDGYRQFTVKLDVGIEAELVSSPAGAASVLRVRLARQLKRRLGYLPPFYLVVEDLSRAGDRTVARHFHGAIALPRVHGKGADAAQEIEAGEKLLRSALTFIATGVSEKKRQRRPGRQRVDLEDPYGKISTWPSYCYKNVVNPDGSVDERRWATGGAMMTKARAMWKLFTGR